MLVRILFPDKYSKAVQKLITLEMSDTFIQPPPFNLEATFADSEAHTPLIFILSPGADPRLEIINLATSKSKNDNFK